MSEPERELRLWLAESGSATCREPNWDDVRRRARRRAGRTTVVLAVAVTALGVGATAFAETVRTGFADLLMGTGEQSVSGARPAEELLVAEHGGRTYRLLRIHTGSLVCLKVAGADPDEGGDGSCVSANELDRSGAVAVPLRVDVGLHDFDGGSPPPPADRATFGLAAPGARRIVLLTEAGEREAVVGNGGFLAVSSGGEDDGWTTGAYAVDETGTRRPVPLAHALRQGVDRHVTGLRPHGPPEAERDVTGGEIAWLARREPRGESASQALRGFPGSAAEFGTFTRIIRPAQGDVLRVALSAPEVRGGEVCVALIGPGGVGGGCAPLEQRFSSGPLDPAWTYAGGGTQFLTVAGIASDEVARIELFLGTGQHRAVPLRDNAFADRVQRAKLPARLVAYDADGRVIGVDTQPAM